MTETYGYVRTSRPRVSELAGSDPETNSRRGWHSLHSRLAQGDTLVVVSIDRIGRRWLDPMGNIHDLQRRGVRIRSLADNEQSWAQYLDADPESPESFLGYTLAGFAAWVSDQELVSIRRRTKAGAGCPSWRVDIAVYRLNGGPLSGRSKPFGGPVRLSQPIQNSVWWGNGHAAVGRAKREHGSVWDRKHRASNITGETVVFERKHHPRVNHPSRARPCRIAQWVDDLKG